MVDESSGSGQGSSEAEPAMDSQGPGQDDGQELVIGLVAPVGADLDHVQAGLSEALNEYEFGAESYRLSDFLRYEMVAALVPPINTTSEYERISTAMDAGDALRKRTRSDEILALKVSEAIKRRREGNPPQPMPRTAHVLRSLKRPEEAFALRRIYGSRFLLVGVYVPQDHRIRYLAMQGMDESKAQALISRDEKGGPHGQKTPETFELADFFVKGTWGRARLVREFKRFLDLVFGSPLVTPKRDEHAMFLAFAASLRSGDLSRQVGAVVAAKDGTVVADGANDAPKFGGGQYWPGDADQRDIVLGYDSNEEIKGAMAKKILSVFDASAPGEDERTKTKELLGSTGVLDITEFGRAVHAEMAALMSCARLGIASAGRFLYCTTFPCHNCAKHIVAAGIKRVYFIEPYAKSRAMDLHMDSVALAAVKNRVEFRPFVGIGPRRYVELFGLRDAFGAMVKRKDARGRLVEWNRRQARPVLRDRLVTYLEQEDWAAVEAQRAVEEAGEP